MAAVEPMDLVRVSLDEQVVIKCKSGRTLKGKLHAFDSHLNIVLGQAEEKLSYMETDPESLEEHLKTVERRFDQLLFVRGDVIILISPVSSNKPQA
jgi:U6 snRNA-associated Sm-like protein LSm3